MNASRMWKEKDDTRPASAAAGGRGPSPSLPRPGVKRANGAAIWGATATQVPVTFNVSLRFPSLVTDDGKTKRLLSRLEQSEIADVMTASPTSMDSVVGSIPLK